ncbi:MAG: prolyl oligopeptidase family serine peptidase [Porphyrobacter sp.]|nr:prolyl oligopeptidase family serine peptidase [Porphyrobacter sp.]
MKIRDIDWVGDDKVAISRSDTYDLGDRFIAKNAEFWNVMILNADGSGEPHFVFHEDRTILNAVYGFYGERRIGGKLIRFYSGLPLHRNQAGNWFYKGDGETLYAVDMTTFDARRVSSVGTSEESKDWLIDERGQIGATLTWDRSSDSWKLENAAGATVAKGSEPGGSVSLIAFSTDGTKIVYGVRPDGEEHATYWQVPVGGGASEQVFTDLKRPIGSFYYDPDTARLTGYRLDRKDAAPVFFDPEQQQRLGGVYGGMRSLNGTLRDFSEDFGKVLVTTEGNNDSGTWFLVDTMAVDAKPIGQSRPQIAPDMVGPVSTINYKAQDGLEIEAILTLPPGREAKNLPAVIFPHGGPRLHDELGFDWWAQAFASRGYAVLQPNFRGSTNKDDAFMHAGDGEWGRKMQTDLSDGLAYLAGQGIVDPKRVCIMGASYGGYAAMAGVTVQSGIYRCAVAVAGVSDLDLFVNRDTREMGDTRAARELRETWLEMMGKRKELSDISPRSLAAKADAPLLLIHGKDDTVVPIQQSKIMADALKAAGKPFEYVVLDGEDHWLSRGETRLKMLTEAVRFVERYNPAD